LAQSGAAKSLEIGNKWIYEYSEEGSPDKPLYEVVTDDTTFSDKTYAVVRLSPFSSEFQRSDSIRIYRYSPFDSSESVLCDFSAKVGDILGSRRVTNVHSQEYWGKSRIFVHLLSSTINSYLGSTYAEGIGLISYSGDAHGHPPYSKRLIGAVLDGIVYGDTTLTSINEPSRNGAPSTITLRQNYPNPFNAQTRIEFFLPAAGLVQMQVFDVTGSQIRQLLESYHTAGMHTIAWDGTNDRGTPCASGLYLLRLSFEKGGDMQTATKKLVLTR
jgi:hypothetical protein